MEFHGMPCSSIKFHVMPWNSMEFLGVPMEFHEMLWSSMEFHGVSMKFNIHSCQFVMRNSLIKQLINLLATFKVCTFYWKEKKKTF